MGRKKEGREGDPASEIPNTPRSYCCCCYYY